MRISPLVALAVLSLAFPALAQPAGVANPPAAAGDPAAPAGKPAAPAGKPAAPAGKPAGADSSGEPEPTLKPSDRNVDIRPADAPNSRPEGSEVDTDIEVDDWFKKPKPAFQLHGYYRVRSELFSHFALGRRDIGGASLWPQPVDNSFTDAAGNETRVRLCGDDPTQPELCENNLHAGANTRLRVTPELTISDNLRIMASVDLFDNLVLGSTPDGYINQPSDAGGYTVRQRGGYAPIGAFAATQWSPSAGQNGLSDSIVVRRAFGEYKSPVATFRFGRMPSHWGLGMLYNAGDGLDSDYGTVVDRIMVTAGIKDWDVYGSLSWDFANEGATNALYLACTSSDDGCGQAEQQGQRFDVMQGDDIDQWSLSIVRRVDDNRARLALARGEVVVNGGIYGIYRSQLLDASYALGEIARDVTPTLVPRGLETVTPDVWGQLLWGKLRIEAEAALIYGSIDNTDNQGGNNFTNPNSSDPDDDGWGIAQFGFALEADYRAVEDRLRLGFGSGFASGDGDVEGINGFGGASAGGAPLGGLDTQLTRDRNFSTFRFHPDYRVDLILWRNILQRVQAAYYFRPSFEYDFVRDTSGQRVGGGAAFIWSRAASPVQTPGNDPDLGFEIDTSLYYQAKGGTFSVDGEDMTGFFARLQYGVLFPLSGLEYLPGEETALAATGDTSLSIAQTLRLYMGILY